MPARQTSTSSLLSCVLSCRCIRTGKQQTVPGVLLLCVICGLTVYMLWSLPNCPLLGRSPQQCSILSMPPHLQVANPAPGPAAVCGTQALCKLWSLPIVGEEGPSTKCRQWPCCCYCCCCQAAFLSDCCHCCCCCGRLLSWGSVCPVTLHSPVQHITHSTAHIVQDSSSHRAAHRLLPCETSSQVCQYAGISPFLPTNTATHKHCAWLATHRNRN
jgi:hypothetical protein